MRPLQGIRVLELGQLIAGPFAGCMLGYFGAEVIKVEAPGKGDPLRNWREVKDGTSLWWRAMARNKRCMTLDLRSDRGRTIARELAARSDVLIENFRPGTMEKWGLGPNEIKEHNPALVYARISGYGQDGPYSTRPGFASACEGVGGFRHINGNPGEPPVRPNLSLGDTLAALHAVIGILMALLHRGRLGRGQGQTVDVAIYEAVFNMLESVVPEFDGAGMVRGPSGSTLTGIVPTGTFACADGRYVVIGGNGDSIYKRLMHAIGRDDLGADPRLADNAGRVEQQSVIEAAIAQWTASLESAQVLEALAEAEVPGGPIYSVADMFDDPHFKARGLFEQVEVDGRPLAIPALVPRLETTPGGTDWPGPALGTHNDYVLGEVLGLDPEERQALAREGVI